MRDATLGGAIGGDGAGPKIAVKITFVTVRFCCVLILLE